MTVVTARSVSQPAVDVTSEYSRKLLGLVLSGAPGSYTRTRPKMSVAAEEPKDTAAYLKLEYRGERFSLGYPAGRGTEDRRKVTELLKPKSMIRNSSCILISTGGYCELSLAQICENQIGDCFKAAFGCHCHSGFGCFQGLKCLQL